MIGNEDDSELRRFENKRRQLFDCLEQAEQGLKGTNLDQAKKVKLNILDKPSDKNLNIAKFRGKESIFKKPELPLIKCLKPRVMPDYQVNPHKWKKYSLSDVDISDRTNTAAAFSFLKELEIKKDGETEDCLDGNSGKLVFNKSVRAKRDLECTEEDTEDKPKLKGAKVVMPEYVIGQRSHKGKKKQRQPKNTDPGKQLALSHLLEDEDE